MSAHWWELTCEDLLTWYPPQISLLIYFPLPQNFLLLIFQSFPFHTPSSQLGHLSLPNFHMKADLRELTSSFLQQKMDNQVHCPNSCPLADNSLVTIHHGHPWVGCSSDDIHCKIPLIFWAFRPRISQLYTHLTSLTRLRAGLGRIRSIYSKTVSVAETLWWEWQLETCS